MLNLSFEHIVFNLIAFLIGAAVHEAAHAWTAYALGDPTPEREGRLTFNPFVHIDMLGLILIVITGFGWAKPVSMNPSMFRGNRRLGILLVALAGPVSNLILAFLIAKISIWAFPTGDIPPLVVTLVWMNLILFLLNLIPVFPLDGEKVLRSLVPMRYIGFFYKMETYGPFILLLIVFTGGMNYILSGPLYWLLHQLF